MTIMSESVLKTIPVPASGIDGFGIKFYAYKKDSGKGVPVYRAYNPNDGHHNFTTDRKEQDLIVGLGWSDEGIAWNVAK